MVREFDSDDDGAEEEGEREEDKRGDMREEKTEERKERRHEKGDSLEGKIHLCRGEKLRIEECYCQLLCTLCTVASKVLKRVHCRL